MEVLSGWRCNLNCLSPPFLSAVAHAFVVPRLRGSSVLCLRHGAMEIKRKPRSNSQFVAGALRFWRASRLRTAEVDVLRTQMETAPTQENRSARVLIFRGKDQP